MSLAIRSAPPSARGGPGNPSKSLEEALRGFESALTAPQQLQLQQIKTVPDADAVMVFTAQLDASNRSRRGRSIATKLYSFLEIVRDFTAIVDAFVSSHPEIAALVWGTVKLAMMLVSNYTSYFEEITKLFVGLKAKFPRFDAYQALFPSSTRLQEALCNFHAAIIRCCKHAVEVVHRPWQQQLWKSFVQDFDKEFLQDRLSIQTCGDEVMEEINLAKARADHQHQQLQAKAADLNKKRGISAFSLSKKTLKELDDLKLQQDMIIHRKQRQDLLDKISSYDNGKPFKDACRRRHGDTTEWIFSTTEFDSWMNPAESSVLWLGGIIGSGKTITTASAIAHVAKGKNSGDRLTYFFLRYDDHQTLITETILRSIIRQSLDLATLSDDIAAMLEVVHRKLCPTIQDWYDLLKKIVLSSKSFYLFLDAIDELDIGEQGYLFEVLTSLLSVAPSGFKIFLATRHGLSNKLHKAFPQMRQLSLDSNSITIDIAKYVEDSLTERMELDPQNTFLFEEIKTRLLEHANGMFLWVTYLLDEVCRQHCVADVRRCLDHLPKDLKETFNRLLSRILEKEQGEIAQKIFPWVAVATRNMTLDELSEAVSISIGQTTSDPDRQLMGKENLASWCENLLRIDEEYQTVEFAHRSIHEFLTGHAGTPKHSQFHIKLEDADHRVGEKCITYLDFSDFKTTIVPWVRPTPRIDPTNIPAVVLGSQNTLLRIASKLTGQNERRPKDAEGFDLNHVPTYRRPGGDEERQRYPFLHYASNSWIYHTKNFHPEKSKTWSLWKRILTEGHILACTPWHEHYTLSEPSVSTWAYHSHHYALVHLLDSLDLGQADRHENILRAVEGGDEKMLITFLEKGGEQDTLGRCLIEASAIGHYSMVKRLLAAGAPLHVAKDRTKVWDLSALEKASEGGFMQIVETLLAAGATATGESGLLALERASYRGHIQIVEKLLAEGSNVSGGTGPEALVSASKSGHIDIVERLLSAGAKATNNEGQQALKLASQHGHIRIVERLLSAGADANGDGGKEALASAFENGHLDVVERLLAVEAVPNSVTRQQALESASMYGHTHIVERLLAAGAEPTGYTGQRALQDASEHGYVQIVEMLLAAGADTISEKGQLALDRASLNGHVHVVERLLVAGAKVTGETGQWALASASEHGHTQVVERLLAAGAKVNGYTGQKALQDASEHGYVQIVEMLLAAGADANSEETQKALYNASKGGHTGIVKRLLAAGADAIEGDLALTNASRGGYTDIVKILLAAGAEGSSQGAQWALDTASKNGHLDIVKILLAAGAEGTGERFYMPMKLASKHGHRDIIKLLQAAGAKK